MKNVTRFLSVLMVLAPLFLFFLAFTAQAQTRSTDLWYPYAEWTFENIDYSGNPFDIDAIANFSDGRKPGLFYDGRKTWKLRYMCTRAGTFSFSVSSTNSDLNGQSGTVICSDTVGRPGPLVPGGPDDTLFFDPALGHPVIPAWAMFPNLFDDKPTEAQLEQWMDNHLAGDNGTKGSQFRGMHFEGPTNRWYNHTCNGTRGDCKSSSNPDPETFRKYEQMFAMLAQRNSFAHIWLFWDCQRDKCDQFHDDRIPQLRMRKYMARRWGAISNWMVGEGFDNFEDDTTEYANQWFHDLKDHMPWHHFIGMRGYKNRLDRSICTDCNYVSFESQEEEAPMTYERWHASRNAATDRPVFEEDRYRYIRNRHKGPRNYDGQIMYMWGQALNLGVGAIYGYLEGSSGHFSRYEGYPEEWAKGIRAWHDFWYATPTDPYHRFLSGMDYCNDLSRDSRSICKKGQAYVFYRENASSLRFDISEMNVGSAQAVALDAKSGRFYDLGSFSRSRKSWTAPEVSTWALAIGIFPKLLDSSIEPGPVLPAPTNFSTSKNGMPRHSDNLNKAALLANSVSEKVAKEIQWQNRWVNQTAASSRRGKFSPPNGEP